LFSIDTGSGFWNPILWVLVIIIAFLMMYILRSLGRKDYRKTTEQIKPFLSGNPELEKDKMHVRGSNLYWGFRESLKGFYNVLLKLHSGNTSDYILWFVVIMAIFFIIIGVI